MRDHTRIEELIAARALGGLDPADAEELARARAEHGPGCLECRRLEDDYREVAGRLAFALPPDPVPEGLEEALVARTLRADRAPAARRWARPLLAAAAAAVVLVAGGLGGYLLAPREEGAADALAAFLAAPGTEVVPFQGLAPGKLSLAFRPGEPEAFLVGADLPPPPEDRVYELWMVRGGTPVRGPTFAPEDGAVILRMEADLTGAQALAVTVEQEGGVDRPTSDPVYTARLPT